MNGRDQKDVLGDRGKPGRGDKGVQRILAEANITTITTLPHPLGQREDDIETEPVRLARTFGIIVEIP